ncbi:MAG: alpha/beta hydrolase [Marinobacter sp.]
MIRQITMVILLLAALLATRTVQAEGSVREARFSSDLLGRDYPYMVYLPEGYGQRRQLYPVVYLLHGSFGGHRDWVRKGRLRTTVDRLIREGEIPPMVIVMPGSRSWWIDGHNEAAGSAFLEELIPHIEDRYRVVAEREWRAVAGLSAGGYGAINFMMTHPDRFVAAAAFSPAIYDPLPPPNSTAWRHPAFVKDGAFDRDLWARHNYTAHLSDYVAGSEVVPLYLTAGDRDPLHASDHALVLANRLEPNQPGLIERDVLPGGHTWGVWRSSLPRGLRFIARYLREPLPAPSEKPLEREP